MGRKISQCAIALTTVAREFLAATDLVHSFQVVSNYISDPRLLICPSDTRTPTNDWRGLTRWNLSYFINPDASTTEPSQVLLGDRNLTNSSLGRSRMLYIETNDLADCSKALHWTPNSSVAWANIAFADGSAAFYGGTNVRAAFLRSGAATTRLVLP